MADYKVVLGTELNTKGIDTTISKYNNKSIEFKSKLNTSGIDKQLLGYSAKKSIKIGSKLDVSNITKQISSYKAKNIKIGIEPNFRGLESKIKAHKINTPLKVDVKLNFAGISGQISEYKARAKIKLDAELNNGAISKSIESFNTANNATKIKIHVEPDFDGVSAKISNYEVKGRLKILPKLSLGEITKQINSYRDSHKDQYILLDAKLKDQALNAEIEKYQAKKKVPVDLTLGKTDDFDTKVSQKLKAYTNVAIEVPVRLKPATKGFDSQITKKSVKIEATLAPDAINKAIEGHTPSAKMPVNIKLVQPKDINAQVKALAIPTEAINVGVKLDESKINADIALFKPTATLGIQPDLILENVDEQIAAYTPKVPVRVNLQINDNDIDKKTGAKNLNTPIQVNVKLDRDKLNEQIRSFTTNSKVKVGVKLDFVGIPEQIRKYQTKTKINAGVTLDKDSIKQQIEQVNVDTPIKLPVELDNSNVQSQIDSIRQQLEKLGNIKIDLIGVGNNSRDNVGGVDNTTNITHKGIPTSNITQNFKEANIQVKTTEDQIKNLGIALRQIGFEKSAIESIISEFKNLGMTVTNVTSKLNGNGSVKLTIQGLDDVKAAVTWVKNIGADGSDGIDTISRKVNNITESFNRLKTLAKDMGNLKLDIFNSNDPAEISRMTEELNRLQKEYDELKASTHSGLNPNQLQQLDNMIKNADASLDKLRNDLANAINVKLFNSDSELSQFDNEIKAVTTECDHLAKKTPELQAAMNSLADAFTRVKNAAKGDNKDELIRANREYEAVLKDVRTQLDINARAEQEAAAAQKLADDRVAFQSKIDAWLTKNSAAAKDFGAKLLELKAKAENCDRTTLNHLENEFRTIDKSAEAAGKKMQSLGDRLKSQFQKYGAYFSVASLVMQSTQALRSMFEQVKLIDSAMTELKKVTNETDASYNKFLSNAANRAKELGTTVDGLVASTADFARLGYGFEDAQGLAEVANIYAVVGDEIESVEDATQSLISTLAAFKEEMNGMDNSEFALSIVDKMNEVANNYAISSGGLGQALQRSASSMAAANNSLDETIAMITAANEIAQNPEKVGKWLCRLKKWLYRLKTRDGSDRGKTL